MVRLFPVLASYTYWGIHAKRGLSMLTGLALIQGIIVLCCFLMKVSHAAFLPGLLCSSLVSFLHSHSSTLWLITTSKYIGYGFHRLQQMGTCNLMFFSELTSSY